MERLSDQKLEGLRQLIGLQMSPKKPVLEDVFACLTELQELRAARASLAHDGEHPVPHDDGDTL